MPSRIESATGTTAGSGTPRSNRETSITEAQIFLTRQCNLSCGYCNLVGKAMDELGLEEWKKGFARLAALGIKTVKILGGEPTIKPWLPEIIRSSSEMGLKTALLSNSLFDDQMLSRLVDAGLWGYYASVDSLQDINQWDSQTAGKAKNGFAMLKRLQKTSIPLLAANIVIHRKNYREVPRLVQRLSDEGFSCNLCSVQHHSGEEREFSRSDVGDSLRFFHEDRNELKNLSTTLMSMQQGGVKISVPAEYLRKMPEYAVECNWKCSELVQLRVDADGGIMLCNEYRTELADRWNIQDLSPAAYADFLKDWKEHRRRLECSGCYWSCFLQAEENLRAGRLEFDFMN
ncbi:MAG: radical SAM protein [Spirochaetales bacterium]|nr:radical SAM protein [Spirochaetales bacterium]MCF7937721.1 radical SAM protein [Spirochaetales bacterium]